MKTRIALILAILMLVLCAAGCKAKTAPAAEATPAPTEAPATEVPATEAPTEAPAEEHPDTEFFKLIDSIHKGLRNILTSMNTKSSF